MPRILPHHWEPSPEIPGSIPPPPHIIHGAHRPPHIEIKQGIACLQDNLEFIAEKLLRLEAALNKSTEVEA